MKIISETSKPSRNYIDAVDGAQEDLSKVLQYGWEDKKELEVLKQAYRILHARKIELYKPLGL